jgi:hypothetical protein
MSAEFNRISHVAALVRPENLEATVAKLSVALQTSFYEPYVQPELGARIAVSWDAGIELVAPLSMEAGGAIAERIQRSGEGWTSVMFNVPDLQETCARLKHLGYEPTFRNSGLTGIEPWVDRFDLIDEATFDRSLFGGLFIRLVTVKERSSSPTP